MPQLDFAAYFHVAIYITIFFFILYLFINMYILPLIYYSLRIRKFSGFGLAKYNLPSEKGSFNLNLESDLNLVLSIELYFLIKEVAFIDDLFDECYDDMYLEITSRGLMDNKYYANLLLEDDEKEEELQSNNIEKE